MSMDVCASLSPVTAEPLDELQQRVRSQNASIEKLRLSITSANSEIARLNSEIAKRTNKKSRKSAGQSDRTEQKATCGHMRVSSLSLPQSSTSPDLANSKRRRSASLSPARSTLPPPLSPSDSPMFAPAPPPPPMLSPTLAPITPQQQNLQPPPQIVQVTPIMGNMNTPQMTIMPTPQMSRMATPQMGSVSTPQLGKLTPHMGNLPQPQPQPQPHHSQQASVPQSSPFSTVLCSPADQNLGPPHQGEVVDLPFLTPTAYQFLTPGMQAAATAAASQFASPAHAAAAAAAAVRFQKYLQLLAYQQTMGMAPSASGPAGSAPPSAPHTPTPASPRSFSLQQQSPSGPDRGHAARGVFGFQPYVRSSPANNTLAPPGQLFGQLVAEDGGLARSTESSSFAHHLLLGGIDLNAVATAAAEASMSPASSTSAPLSARQLQAEQQPVSVVPRSLHNILA